MPTLYNLDTLVPQFQIGGDECLTFNFKYGWYRKKREPKQNKSIFMEEAEEKNNLHN